MECSSTQESSSVSPHLAFDSALVSLQSGFHRLSRERQSWMLERQELQVEISSLKQDKRQLQQLHDLLLRRVRMLEFALRSERLAGRSASPIAGSSHVPALPRPPALDYMASNLRASQLAIHELLAVVRRAEADALSMMEPSQKTAAHAPTVGNDVFGGPSPSLSAVPVSADAQPRITTTVHEPEVDATGASPDIPAIGNAKPQVHRSEVIAEMLGGQDMPSASRLSPPVGQGGGALHGSLNVATPPARRRVSLTGGRATKSGLAAASAPRIRGGATTHAAPDVAPTLPVTWHQGVVLRSHVDVVRYVFWIPQPAVCKGSGELLPQLLSCSDDGTAKIWTISIPGALPSGAAPVEHPSIDVAAAANTVPEKPTHGPMSLDFSEPLRTYRAGCAGINRATVATWHPRNSSSGGSDREGGDGFDSTTSSFVGANLAIKTASEGLSLEASARLQESTRVDAVGVLGTADGAIAVVFLPKMLSSDSSNAKLGFPTPYDVPSAAMLPVLRVENAHSDCIWALEQAPPGYPIPQGMSADLGEDRGGVLFPGPPRRPDADTRSVPVIMSAAADGLVRFWRLGLTSSHQPSVEPIAAYSMAAILSPADFQNQQIGMPAFAISDAKFDLTSSSLCVWVAFRFEPVVVKLDCSTGTVVARARAHHAESTRSEVDGISSISVHPVLSLLVAGAAAAPGGIFIFDSLSGRQLYTIAGSGSCVSSLAIDPSGALLSSCGTDGEVRVWSFERRVCMWSSRAHRIKHLESALSVAFDPHRPALLASAGADSLVKVFAPRISPAGISPVGM
jgi:WD40 repeat protein